jgi:hypothetical protein
VLEYCKAPWPRLQALQSSYDVAALRSIAPLVDGMPLEVEGVLAGSSDCGKVARVLSEMHSGAPRLFGHASDAEGCITIS